MCAKATGKGARASDETYDSYRLLIESATQVDVIETAVAHPCDESSLSAVVHAAKQGLIQPLLVGPEASIRDVANECQLDISAYEIIDADSHRAKMASCAVAAIYTHALRTGEPWKRPAGIKP
jgi:phosphate acetyltransferase